MASDPPARGAGCRAAAGRQRRAGVGLPVGLLDSGGLNTLRRRLPLCTWFAILAMLALALLPTVSHAVAHGQGSRSAWAEVCTPQGMKWVAVDAASAAANPSPSRTRRPAVRNSAAMC